MKGNRTLMWRYAIFFSSWVTLRIETCSGRGSHWAYKQPSHPSLARQKQVGVPGGDKQREWPGFQDSNDWDEGTMSCLALGVVSPHHTLWELCGVHGGIRSHCVVVPPRAFPLPGGVRTPSADWHLAGRPLAPEATDVHVAGKQKKWWPLAHPIE